MSFFAESTRQLPFQPVDPRSAEIVMIGTSVRRGRWGIERMYQRCRLPRDVVDDGHNNGHHRRYITRTAP